jgi:hypothetical protein
MNIGMIFNFDYVATILLTTATFLSRQFNYGILELLDL